MTTEPVADNTEAKKIGILVLGLGNVLLGDDGLGAAAVARLEQNYRVPAGVLGVASRSHPEMASEIVNRAIPVDRIRVSDHSVAKTLHLADNGCDKFIQSVGDGA